MPGDFCEAAHATSFAPGLVSGGGLRVDSATGNDATPCCGIGSNGPCQTLSHAMRLIDNAQAQGVVMTAGVNGGGGDWAPAAGEPFPVVLGWGVELSAPGVFFTDISTVSAIFELGFYSANDTVGHAQHRRHDLPADRCRDESSQQPPDDGPCRHVEVGANQDPLHRRTVVNGNATTQTSAITVDPGGSLLLGQDPVLAAASRARSTSATT